MRIIDLMPPTTGKIIGLDKTDRDKATTLRVLTALHHDQLRKFRKAFPEKGKEDSEVQQLEYYIEILEHVMELVRGERE